MIQEGGQACRGLHNSNRLGGGGGGGHTYTALSSICGWTAVRIRCGPQQPGLSNIRSGSTRNFLWKPWRWLHLCINCIWLQKIQCFPRLLECKLRCRVAGRLSCLYLILPCVIITTVHLETLNAIKNPIRRPQLPKKKSLFIINPSEVHLIIVMHGRLSMINPLVLPPPITSIISPYWEVWGLEEEIKHSVQVVSIPFYSFA